MKTDLLVSISDDHLDRVDGIVKRLEAEGMEVRHLLPELGTVTGAIDDSRVEVLNSIDGVAAVEAAREVEIAPESSSAAST